MNRNIIRLQTESPAIHTYPLHHWQELSRFIEGEGRDPKNLFRLADDVKAKRGQSPRPHSFVHSRYRLRLMIRQLQNLVFFLPGNTDPPLSQISSPSSVKQPTNGKSLCISQTYPATLLNFTTANRPLREAFFARFDLLLAFLNP